MVVIWRIEGKTIIKFKNCEKPTFQIHILHAADSDVEWWHAWRARRYASLKAGSITKRPAEFFFIRKAVIAKFLLVNID